MRTKMLLAAMAILPSAVMAQTDTISSNLTPIQLVWTLFATAAIVLLFVLYHLHLESKRKGRK